MLAMNHATITKGYIKVLFSCLLQNRRSDCFVFIFLDKGSLFVKSRTNLDNDRVLVLVAGQHKY